MKRVVVVAAAAAVVVVVTHIELLWPMRVHDEEEVNENQGHQTPNLSLP